MSRLKSLALAVSLAALAGTIVVRSRPDDSADLPSVVGYENIATASPPVVAAPVRVAATFPRSAGRVAEKPCDSPIDTTPASAWDPEGDEALRFIGTG